MQHLTTVFEVTTTSMKGLCQAADLWVDTLMFSHHPCWRQAGVPAPVSWEATCLIPNMRCYMLSSQFLGEVDSLFGVVCACGQLLRRTVSSKPWGRCVYGMMSLFPRSTTAWALPNPHRTCRSCKPSACGCSCLWLGCPIWGRNPPAEIKAKDIVSNIARPRSVFYKRLHDDAHIPCGG